MNKKQNVKALDVTIKRQMIELEKVDKGTEEYTKRLGDINRLAETRKSLEDVPNPASKLNINTVFGGIVSIAGIFLVTYYEKADVITSKAYNMATRLFK